MPQVGEGGGHTTHGAHPADGHLVSTKVGVQRDGAGLSTCHTVISPRLKLRVHPIGQPGHCPTRPAGPGARLQVTAASFFSASTLHAVVQLFGEVLG